MSRAVIYESLGGPEVLELREVPVPHPGPDEVRVRVTAAGLNPMDWMLSSMPAVADAFGLTRPSGFGYDLAGVIEEAGGQVTGFSAGDRVYGGALGRAVADHAVLKPADGTLLHTPDAISDEVASTLYIAGRTADAALHAIGLRAGDTVFDSHDDHRLVMAAAVLGLAVPGLRVHNAATVGKTFPGFGEAWLRMLEQSP